jgi:hypothetical protein
MKILQKSFSPAQVWWLTPIILVTWEAENRNIAVRGQPRQIVCKNCPHLQNNQSKMDWKYISSSRLPALQEQSSKFKPQFHQKGKRKRNSPSKNKLKSEVLKSQVLA